MQQVVQLAEQGPQQGEASPQVAQQVMKAACVVPWALVGLVGGAVYGGRGKRLQGAAVGFVGGVGAGWALSGPCDKVIEQLDERLAAMTAGG